MEKHLLSLVLIGLGVLSHAQVGVGTNDPKSTLHIIGSPTVNTTPDGVIPPIISRTSLIAKTGYTTSQKGAIVYVDDITGTAPTVGSSTEKVTSIGYYYFDGTIWNKLNNIITASNGLNKDTTSGDVQLGGTLSKATTVAQAANTLAFTGTAVNAFFVDGTTLSVDAANNRVGLGTAAPTNALHVKATANPVKLEGLVDGTLSDKILTINASTGEVKTIPSINALSIPTPAVFRLENEITNFLNGISSGASSVIPMTMIKNAIPGLSYDASTSIITFPAGTYQLSLVYEATHNLAGCTISSYIVDFPNAAGQPGTRIHNTATHLEGGLSNHGGTILYTTTFSEVKTWSIKLGRGQSGNCSGTGMNLAPKSTHFVALRIGD